MDAFLSDTTEVAKFRLQDAADTLKKAAAATSAASEPRSEVLEELKKLAQSGFVKTTKATNLDGFMGALLNGKLFDDFTACSEVEFIPAGVRVKTEDPSPLRLLLCHYSYRVLAAVDPHLLISLRRLELYYNCI